VGPMLDTRHSTIRGTLRHHVLMAFRTHMMMDTIEEKALNPCHILVQAIPKRQLSSKEEGLGRIFDQLIFRYRGIYLLLLARLLS